MSSPASVVLVGATGLTGAAAFRSILASPSFASLIAITRKPLEAPATTAGSGSPAYTNKVVDFGKPDTWGLADAVSSTSGGLSQAAFVSCLGTTRAAAGSLEAQKAIDEDLNLALARAAKDAGISTYILVSSGAASATSYSPYLQMKGRLEDGVKEMGFKSVYILQPGLLLGARTETRTAEGLTQSLFRGLSRIGLPMNKFSIDAEDVGKAIAKAAAERKEGVHYLSNAQIIALAKGA